jgi:hypothetical protein
MDDSNKPDGVTLHQYFAAHAPAVPRQFKDANMRLGEIDMMVLWAWAYADMMVMADEEGVEGRRRMMKR